MGALDGRVAVVVGGTGGIGGAIAHALRDAGALVVPTSRDEAAVHHAVDVLGGDVVAHACDTTDRDSLAGLRDAVLARHGRVDVLVNSAGTHQRKPSLDVTPEEWRRVLDVNLTGTFLACQAFGAPMVAAGRGAIVNILSMGARVALAEATAYCASKGGVEQVTRALAAEWASHGVRVNAIMPGFFLTDLNRQLIAPGTDRRARIDARTPLGRVGRVEELGGAAVYLCSDAASFVTGTTIEVDGGFLAAGI